MIRRLPIIVVAVVALAALATLLFAHRGAAPAAVPESAAPAVTTARARFETFTYRVHAAGRVGIPAGGDAKLPFAGSGIIAHIDVHVGQLVHAGDALAMLDTSGLVIDAAQAGDDARAAAANYGGGSVPAGALRSAEARLRVARAKFAAAQLGTGSAQSDVQAARAAVRTSEAKLTADRASLARAQSLYAGGVTAQKDVDAARQALVVDQADADANRAKLVAASSAVGSSRTQAQADLAQAQSDVRTAQAQQAVIGAQASSAQEKVAATHRMIASATLRAPSDGVVVAILKHPGEAVDPAQPAVVVGPRTSNVITLGVSGEDARRIHVGDHATVLPQRGGHATTMRVRGVVPSVDPATQTTTVELAGTLPGAASGDPVTATIDVGTARGIVIPTTALIEDPGTGASIVFVRETGGNGHSHFVSRTVTARASDERTSLITSGLRAGDTVATQGAFNLLAAGG